MVTPKYELNYIQVSIKDYLINLDCAFLPNSMPFFSMNEKVSVDIKRQDAKARAVQNQVKASDFFTKDETIGICRNKIKRMLWVK